MRCVEMTETAVGNGDRRFASSPPALPPTAHGGRPASAVRNEGQPPSPNAPSGGNLRNRNVEELERRAFGRLNRGRFGRPKVNARAFGYVVILAVQMDAALPFHQIEKLVFFR